MAILNIRQAVVTAWRALDAVAGHKCWCISAMALMAFFGSMAVAWHNGMPYPTIHDEFSYLLAGDTFAHGRMTNPSPRMWKHFETFHELLRPTYMSKYPPAQGLFLAAGKILFGHPVFGVWLSDALMCASLCWMLYAWVPRRWALIGGLITVVQFGVFTYWSQSYWGGAVAATAGALIFGAIPRILKSPNFFNIGWLLLGTALAINSRPFEALILGVPMALLLLAGMKVKKEVLFQAALKSFLPFLIGVLIIMGTVFFYNKKITGNYFIFPYQLYTQTYSSLPSVFLWQKLQPPVHFNNDEMQKYENTWVRGYFLKKRTAAGFIQDMKMDAGRLWYFYFGYPLAMVALAMVLLVGLNKRRAFFIMAALVMAGCLNAILFCSVRAHYYAFFTCLVVLLIVHGLRLVSLLKYGSQRLGIMLVLALVLFQASLNARHPFHAHTKSLASFVGSSSLRLHSPFTREQLDKFLHKRSGRYLIIVHYPAWHNFHNEWVYNNADIDTSKVIWVRDLGERENEKLLAYFKNRQVYYVQVVWDLHPKDNPKSI